MRRKKLVISFYRQLGVLLEAGFSLMRAMEIFGARVSNRSFRSVIARLVDSVRKGNAFWESLEREPAMFPDTHVQMIRAGEYSGRLATVLERLAEAGARELALRSRLRAMLAYPCIVLIVAVALVGFLSATIVPTFAGLFEELGEQLPGPARVLIGASEMLRLGWINFAGAAVALAAIVYILGRVPRARRLRDWLRLRFVVFGPLTREQVVVQTCNTLAMLLQAGINLVRALELTRDASPNRVVADGLEQARVAVTAGRGLEGALRRAEIFPPLVVDMIATAQETGTLDENLRRASEIYSAELDNKIRLLSSLTAPVLVIMVGAVVLFVAFALFMPYLRLMTVMGGE
jgi:type II secretory pathway component PulF